MSELKENATVANEQPNEIFSASNPTGYFSIAFDELFENEKLSVYNEFDITSKRHFKNLSPDIVETYNEIFAPDGKLTEEAALTVLKLLSSQTKIMTKQITLQEFLAIVDDITDAGDGLLLQTIHNFIENNYSLELDKITEQMKSNKKTVNDELFISDTAAKIYLEISYLSRKLILLHSRLPLIQTLVFLLGMMLYYIINIVK